MVKKTSFESYFGSFGPNLDPQKLFPWILSLLDVRNCCKLAFYAISRKTNKPKNLVSGPIFAHFA